MAPAFHPRLINPPFGDPGLFVPFAHQKKALVFDLGENESLTAREVLKITQVYVSHAHMDHFVGFDRLLRLFLARPRQLALFGPAGIINQTRAKLNAYTWNLVQADTHPFAVQVFEITAETIRTQCFACADRFQPAAPAAITPVCHTARGGISLHKEDQYHVQAVILDHGTPCLGFRLTENFHIHILTSELAANGFQPGPWLNRFKQAIYRNAPKDTMFEVPCAAGGVSRQTLGVLKPLIARIRPGQEMAYITDVAGHTENLEKIVAFVAGADRLFIESPFREIHRDLARKKHHLTTTKAGQIAARAGVGHFTLFHFSPRYENQWETLEAEAVAACLAESGRIGSRDKDHDGGPRLPGCPSRQLDF